MTDAITYAQNREDLYIAGFFPDVENGFYVDVGAQHPVRDSVTKYFSLLGWTGINIEPQRKYHELLAADRPKDINLNMGISDAAGSLQLREFPSDGLSTFSDVLKSEYEQDEHMRSAGHTDYDVTVDTLANVFAEHVPERQTIHFMKVDVEGLEYQVFLGNDWSRFRPIVLCVEANHIIQDWHQLLADANYEKVLFDGLNEYFLAKEHIARFEHFAFVRMFLVEKQIKPFFLSSHIADLHGQIHHLATEAAQLNARHAEALARVTGENASLEEKVRRWEEQAQHLEAKARHLEENVAKLHASNKSIKFHLRSLRELGKERVARRVFPVQVASPPPGDHPGSKITSASPINPDAHSTDTADQRFHDRTSTDVAFVAEEKQRGA
ncbi:FkbM family methyltransferase [Catellatospora paridis]|uniref:FkbM family methyltransferase n=1 Tax=Catellatospora paridis TaxID=1617086 RepID=UPI0012D48D16|nr:FkbM family methyltransferase [Catellatospora paridis]